MLTGQTVRINHVCNLNKQDVLTFLISSFNFTQIKINLRKKKTKKRI